MHCFFCIIIHRLFAIHSLDYLQTHKKYYARYLVDSSCIQEHFVLLDLFVMHLFINTCYFFLNSIYIMALLSENLLCNKCKKFLLFLFLLNIKFKYSITGYTAKKNPK